MAVSRTITLNDLQPSELAEIFTDFNDIEQAEFFAAILPIAAKWPGAGWCQQSCGIANALDGDGIFVIQKLAEHVAHVVADRAESIA